MRSLSNAVKAEIAKTTGVQMRTGLVLYLDEGTLRYTDHDYDVVFLGETFTARAFKHSSIKTFYEAKTDNVDVSIDNVDLVMSAYYFASQIAGKRASIYRYFLATASCTLNGDTIKSATTIPYENLTGTFPAAGTASINGERFTYTGNTGTTLTGCSARRNNYLDGAAISGSYPIASDDGVLMFSGFIDTPSVSESFLKIRIVNVFDRSKSKAPWRLFNPRCNWDFCGTQCGYNSGVKERGTADSGATTSLTDSTLIGAASMVGGTVRITQGVNKGQTRYISAHNTGTGQISWVTAMPAACNTTTKYVIECDKTRAACSGFGNEAKFDGYDGIFQDAGVQLSPTGSASLRRIYENRYWDTVSPMAYSDDPMPLVYGQNRIRCVVLSAYNYSFFNNSEQQRYYGICEGTITSIDSVMVNGTAIDTTKSTAYKARLGVAGQSLGVSDFGAGWVLPVRNWPSTAFFGIWNNTYVPGSTGINTSHFNNILTPDHSADVVEAIVSGLKVQKYLANGSTDGATAFSQNPIWCLLDFIMNRCMRPTLSNQIDFSAAKAAADLCDTLNYNLNLILNRKDDEKKIIELMLAACRGFITYDAGKMAIRVEEAGASVHSFDMTNMTDRSFTGPYEKDINDIPNRIIVKYLDSEIRQNMALVDGYLADDATTIPYGDLNGSFSASGTVYLGQEAVTYTGNTGTSLTGCSVRTRDYQSGYPLFQGVQTYPEMTAIYNDWDDQDKKGRVVDKEIDGRAIPTYDQAFRVAEWTGRRLIEGNAYCKMDATIDSMAVQVGDVVTVTHDVPGWAAEEFRIIEAAEDQDGQAQYVAEVYDDSFYNESDATPGPILDTTLPSPYEPPDHVTDVTLVEGGFVGPDGTFIPTITVSYTLPTEKTFWEYAIISLTVNGNPSAYTKDYSRGIGYVFDGISGGFIKGDLVAVKVISVSAMGVSADEATAPTESITLAASSIVLTTPSGLALEGGGTVWNGLKFAVTWTVQGTGNLDPSYITNEVQVITGSTVRGTFYTKNNRWEYIYGDGFDAALDSFVVAANGAVTIKVRRTSSLAANSSQATLAITQAVPDNPQNGVIQALARGAKFSWDKNLESDLKEYQVRTKITSGGTFSSWLPIHDNQYTRMLTTTEISNYGYTPAIYFEVKTIDLFGNASSASSANVAALYYGVTNLDVDDISADKITAGSIRGINLQSGSYVNKGTYLTEAADAADTTLTVKDTTDFASSGDGWILDSTNDRDAFSWTGKTAYTLTGCSGVLAHGNGAIVLPKVKNIVIISDLNDIRIYGDRGDGTIEELAAMGVSSTDANDIVASFGSSTSEHVAIRGEATGGSSGVVGQSDGPGVQGFGADGVVGWNLSGTTGSGVYGHAYDSVALKAKVWDTGVPLHLVPLSTAPTTGFSEGSIYYNSTDHKLYVYNGSTWTACN